MNLSRVSSIIAAGMISFAMLALHSASAQSTRADAEKDPVLKAMLEELDRSMTHLQLPGFSKPYFIEYRIEDVQDFERAQSTVTPASHASP
jgi:hypothetical protein